MEKNCPKCGKKLSLFYIKENCDKCGCNLMYYNMESRLEEDNIKAEAEFRKLEEVKEKFRKILQKILEVFSPKKKQGEQK